MTNKIDDLVPKDSITCDELYELYAKQNRRLHLIIKHNDHQARELMILNEELKQMANTDPMTGAYNRRYFYDVAKELIFLSQRESTPLGIIMLDIDKFKSINDTYGHDIGDIVIKELVAQVSNNIRHSDILARFGGEKFVVIFPNTSLEGTRVIAEKIREKVENTVTANNIRFTVSIGVTVLKIDENDIEDSLKRADEALYIAKESGRNRVVVFQD